MLDIVLDTLIDCLKLLPFLFIAFLIMEYFEHKIKSKSKKKIEKAGKFGPLFGGLLGAIPQCGFSVLATNLYATRIITIGTLISIYLSTSDEMLLILISEKVDTSIIVKILLFKVVIGILAGFVIDLIIRKKKDEKIVKEFCKHSHCDCEHSLLKSTIKHTLNIFIFLFITSLILHLGMHYFGEEIIEKILLKESIFGPFISSLIGLIPNCASSVILTKLYVTGIITLPSLISGLLTGSGVAILVLFKINKNIKENINILLLLYLIGSITGVILSLF